jgi:hypothetical protein
MERASPAPLACNRAQSSLRGRGGPCHIWMKSATPPCCKPGSVFLLTWVGTQELMPHIVLSGQVCPAVQSTYKSSGSFLAFCCASIVQFSQDLRDLTKALLSKMPSKRPTPDAILKLPWLKVCLHAIRTVCKYSGSSSELWSRFAVQAKHMADLSGSRR